MKIHLLTSLGLSSIIVILSPLVTYAIDCELMAPSEPIEQSLANLIGLSFKGFKPLVSRVEGEPMLKILRYSSEPSLNIVDGKLIVSSTTCGGVPQETIRTENPTTSLTPPTMSPTRAPATSGVHQLFSKASFVTVVSVVAVMTSSLTVSTPWTTALTGMTAFGAFSLLPLAQGQAGTDDPCEQVIEVEISGPTKSVGAVYMEEMIKWPDYDDAPDSMHFRPTESWSQRVEASRAFRRTESGSIYNYRNKVLMGMAQSRILNEAPETTPKDAVTFDLPTDVTRPATDEEVMMLSVLEMQALLRSGQISSVELTNIALSMLDKYDPEFNMNEVDTRDLALRIAAEADALFAQEDYRSYIQGIPFAIKDTYDVAGYATAYGSWEFMENIVETESPLVTYAVQNYGVPLFKTSVPQMTWGTANYKGNVYSCLNGGFAGGAGNSGGSSLGSGAAVCLGVVPVAICEQTGSSCQSPAIANGVSTIIPAIGTFSRENNGLYSLESDRPGLLCRDVMSCAVFYNYMRGESHGDPQSRDVPFGNPAAEDLSTYTIAFVDNSNTSGWPLAWDTPFMGRRGNVVEALQGFGANVTVYESLSEIMTPDQLYKDMTSVGVSNTQGFDWYWLNVEGFFERVFKYGGSDAFGPLISYGPQYRRQNNNFDGGSPHVTHIGATAYAYLDSMWMFGYAAEKSVFPMMQEQMPDVVVHFGQSELAGAFNTNLIKRAGINTVHFPEFYFDIADPEYADIDFTRPEDFYSATATHAAMITCESKKYEPVKALAVCHALQKALVPGGKLISPNIETIQQALASGEHNLNCPYDWSNKMPNYLDIMPADVAERVRSNLGNIGTIGVCPG